MSKGYSSEDTAERLQRAREAAKGRRSQAQEDADHAAAQEALRRAGSPGGEPRKGKGPKP
jgi:hypothetical protein